MPQTNADWVQINRKAWNLRTVAHIDSDFYNLARFKITKNDLPEIDLEALGDIKGKKILHLQCHFGMNSLSMVSMGANVTGADLSDASIQKAQELSLELHLPARFIRANIYDLPVLLHETFDMVYTSWGALCWLPDLYRWGKLVRQFIKPGGVLHVVEFHPVLYMMGSPGWPYDYFGRQPVDETEAGSYAGPKNHSIRSITFDHPTATLINAVIQNGLQIKAFREFDYMPYPVFNSTDTLEKGKWRLEGYDRRMPYAYHLHAVQPG